VIQVQRKFDASENGCVSFYIPMASVM